MKLSKELELWHCDRPDEWKMDEFRRNAEKLEVERDALAAQVELYKRRSLNLSILVDELIDHLRYNKAERGDVLQEFWDKKEAIPRVPNNPQQALVEIRVEAGRAGYLQGLDDGKSYLPDDEQYSNWADEWAEKIRQGGANDQANMQDAWSST